MCHTRSPESSQYIRQALSSNFMKLKGLRFVLRFYTSFQLRQSQFYFEIVSNCSCSYNQGTTAKSREHVEVILSDVFCSSKVCWALLWLLQLIFYNNICLYLIFILIWEHFQVLILTIQLASFKCINTIKNPPRPYQT